MDQWNEQVAYLLTDAIEFHVHFAPDGLTPRKNDAFELLREAKSAGMRAVVLKNKSCGTGAIAQLANKYANGAHAIGGITMDVSVGGFNPEAVAIEAAIGSKVVWMPTYSAQNDPTKKKTEQEKRRNSLSVLDQNNKLLPEIHDILEIIKDHDMILATGHISRKEIFTLFEAAADIGIEKLVVNHPLNSKVGVRLDLADQIALTQMGAYMEHCWVSAMPMHSHLPPKQYIDAIHAVGFERCILSTDFGQVHHPTPLEGFKLMLKTLLQEGMKIQALERMVKINPAHILDLD